MQGPIPPSGSATITSVISALQEGRRWPRQVAIDRGADAALSSSQWNRADADTPRTRTVLNRLRELVGIYGLGFNRESFLGLILPFAIVFIVGGLGVFLVTEGFGLFPDLF